MAQHVITTIDLRLFGGSALTADMAVPKDRPLDAPEQGIPVTYVPARNTIFLSFALAWAEVLECSDIFIGVNALDYSGYPDCRPEYIAAYEQHGQPGDQGRRGGAAAPDHPHAADRADQGADHPARPGARRRLRADDHLLRPVAPSGAACGHCDACLLRLRGFAEAGAHDPVAYRRMTYQDAPAMREAR